MIKEVFKMVSLNYKKIRTLKIHSWLIILSGIFLVCYSIAFLLVGIKAELNPVPNPDWSGLGILFGPIGIAIFSPLIIAGISTLKYVKNKCTFETNQIINIITLISQIIFFKYTGFTLSFFPLSVSLLSTILILINLKFIKKED